MAPSVLTIHLLLPLLLLTFTCEAQDSPPPPPPQAFNAKFNPSMAVIIVVLIIAFFFLGLFSIYLRQCGDDREESVRLNRTGRSRRAARRGLDPAMIETLPTLVYSDVKEHKIGKGALECAVCISEFEDDEVLRLLPKCDHVFHPECIDQWLESHTTCPVCRANLAVSDDHGVSPLPSEAFGAGVSMASAVPVVTPAADAGVPAGAEEDDQRSPRPDHVVIPVAEESVEVERERGTEGSTTPRAVDLRRTRSRRSFKYRFSWRSKSARPAIGARAAQFWPEEEHEKFTLRLPEYVRREVLSGKLRRSVSVLSFPAQESSRRGYRGEGSSRGGRSFKNGGGRWDWATKSDRWAFLSFNWRGGGDGDGSIKRGDGSMKRGEGSMKRGEGSMRKGGDEGGNEGSTKGKVTSSKRGGRPSGLVAGSGVSREAESTNADVEGSKKELVQV